MLTCKEVCRSIAADESATTDWRRRWSIKLHLLMCRYCRRYCRQIEALGTAARDLFGSVAEDPCSRDRLRDSILERVSTAREDDTDPTT